MWKTRLTVPPEIEQIDTFQMWPCFERIEPPFPRPIVVGIQPVVFQGCKIYHQLFTKHQRKLECPRVESCPFAWRGSLRYFWWMITEVTVWKVVTPPKLAGRIEVANFCGVRESYQTSQVPWQLQISTWDHILCPKTQLKSFLISNDVCLVGAWSEIYFFWRLK